MGYMTEFFHSDWPYCAVCGESWYAHVDHDHTENCPFGDCGKYTRPASDDDRG